MGLAALISSEISYEAPKEPEKSYLVAEIYHQTPEMDAGEVYVEETISGSTTSKDALKALVRTISSEYGVDFYIMDKIIECESFYQPDIQSYAKYPDGSQERSFGLVQIHELAHPNITREQMLDPEFSIRFLAENLAKGKGSMWTCYNQMLFGGG